MTRARTRWASIAISALLMAGGCSELSLQDEPPPPEASGACVPGDCPDGEACVSGVCLPVEDVGAMDGGSGDGGPGDVGPTDGGPRCADEVCIARVSTGRGTCAVSTDGALYCWGDAPGIGTEPAPVSTRPGPTWSVVQGPRDHACGLDADGTLYCWGNAAAGQTGNPDSSGRVLPEGGPSRWSTVDVGHQSTCAIDEADGSLWCWGSNDCGEIGLLSTETDLGDGGVPDAGAAMTSVDEPTRLDGGPFIDVSVAEQNGCAVRTDGTIVCWGSDGYGQLGRGTGRNDGEFCDAPRLPGEVDGIRAVDVAVGGWHACAVTMDDALYCWGYGHGGRLGLDSFEAHDTPERVGSDSDWASVSLESDQTCAIKRDGSLWCWGFGPVGDGTDEDRASPTRIGAGETWIDVSAGTTHTCAVRDDGTVWCWGRAADGRLGLGEFPSDGGLPESVTEPMRVTFPTP